MGILDFPSFRNDDIERLYWLDIENSSFIAKIWQFWNKNPFLEDNQVATQTSMTANDLKEELVIEGDGSRDLLVAGTTLYLSLIHIYNTLPWEVATNRPDGSTFSVNVITSFLPRLTSST